MPISIKTESLGCRMFEDGKSAENLDPYCGVGSIDIYGKTAIGKRFKGSLTREDIHKIVRDVKELGCKWFLAERAESHRMPRGRILEDGPFEGYHCTDLTKWEFENE